MLPVFDDYCALTGLYVFAVNCFVLVVVLFTVAALWVWLCSLLFCYYVC